MHNPQPANAETPNLRDLVAALPEIYQPIFGHTELSEHVSRKCEDRLAHIAHIYQMLESQLNRPLRVLDLGCAQGFFSLSLAKMGATVHGIDFQTPNIAVCNALAAEHPELKASFRMGLIEEAIIHLQPNQYDLVLGLSVFHHIVHRAGIALVQTLLTTLANKTAVGLFEMALSKEPPDWAKSQPQYPRHLLQGYAFVHELAQNETHLSALTRPLYVASNSHWFLNGTIGQFDTWRTEPHALANNASRGTRRYFFGNGILIKQFMLDVSAHYAANTREHENEVSFLDFLPTNFRTPMLLLHGRHESEAWIVRETLPGELLLDIIRSGSPYDTRSVLQDVLEQLTALEATGLYHDDLRTWNILIGPDGHATLIDYGAVSTKAEDCAWPHNIFLSFMAFTREVLTRTVLEPYPIRTPSLNPAAFPEPYRSIFWKLFALPSVEWRFDKLLNEIQLIERDDQRVYVSPQNGSVLALQALDDACATYYDTMQLLADRLIQANNVIKQLQTKEA
jgi:O-antigen chain-terminating methyltransferase